MRVAPRYSVPVGTGAAAALDQTDAGTATVVDEDEEGDDAESGDSSSYNEDNVAVVDLEDEPAVDVTSGHVGDGSEHQTANDEDGSGAENSNRNDVAVVRTQDNAIVKGGDEDGNGDS